MWLWLPNANVTTAATPTFANREFIISEVCRYCMVRWYVGVVDAVLAYWRGLMWLILAHLVLSRVCG